MALILNNPAPVVVRWRDASGSTSAWQRCDSTDESDVQTILECLTMGFLIRQTDREVVVAQSLAAPASDDAQFCHCMAIPRESVVQIQVVTLGRSLRPPFGDPS